MNTPCQPEPWPLAPPPDRAQQERYARQALIAGWDQRLLARSRVLVAGAGAIGNEALSKLAMMGVGGITVLDRDRIEASNLARTVLFRAAEVGAPKALVAAARLRELNPELRVEAITGELQHALGEGLLAEHDLVLGCLDNLQARLWLNRLCLRVGVPWIDAALGEAAAAVQVIEPEAQACYECTLPASARRRLAAAHSCAGLLVRAHAVQRVPATATAAALAAGMQVHLALALLHARGGAPLPRSFAAWPRPWTSRRLYLEASTWSLRVVELRRAAGCTAHERWPPPPPLPLGAQARLDELGRALAALGVPAPQALVLAHPVVQALRCERCGARESCGRPHSTALLVRAGWCRCGGERQPELAHEAAFSGPLGGRTLEALGVAPRAWITVRCRDGERRYALAAPAGGAVSGTSPERRLSDGGRRAGTGQG